MSASPDWLGFPAELAPPPPDVGVLPGEMIPDGQARRVVWHVQPFTPDGHVPAPCAGRWAAFTAEEALQAVVALARADGWPVAELRWSVTLADAGEVTP